MNTLLVIAMIAGRRCAIEAPQVASVIEIGAITPVPRTPDYIVGICAVRSQVLSVIDGRIAIGFEADQFPLDHRAFVAHQDGDAYAIRVDTIEDVCTALSEAEEIPGGFGEQWSKVARGFVETPMGPALLLDIEALILARDAFGAAA